MNDDEQTSASASPEPRPVIPLGYARPSAAAADRSGWPPYFAWAAVVIACAALVYKTESVLVSGPILTAIGIGLICYGGWGRRSLAGVVGISLIAVCGLFFGCVLMFGWGPGKARLPFLTMGGGYAIVVSGVCLSQLMRSRQPGVSDYRSVMHP